MTTFGNQTKSETHDRPSLHHQLGHTTQHPNRNSKTAPPTQQLDRRLHNLGASDDSQLKRRWEHRHTEWLRNLQLEAHHLSTHGVPSRGQHQRRRHTQRSTITTLPPPPPTGELLTRHHLRLVLIMTETRRAQSTDVGLSHETCTTLPSEHNPPPPTNLLLT